MVGVGERSRTSFAEQPREEGLLDRGLVADRLGQRRGEGGGDHVCDLFGPPAHHSGESGCGRGVAPMELSDCADVAVGGP